MYFFRAWKEWIKQSGKYNLEQHFVSSNAFTCMEINAYALIHLIIKFRDEKTPELFMPTLFTSQMCESAFRQMRSMTTINWTRINFSPLELFHIVGRIELINDIVNYESDGQDLVFPRIQKHSKNNPSFSMPTDDEIRNILFDAQKRALINASKLEMHIELPYILQCQVTRVSLKEIKNDGNKTIITETEEENSLSDQTFSCNSLRDYTRENIEIDENSKFVQVFNDDGTSRCVLKSSLLWLMTESKNKLSKDRLTRVRGTTTPKRKSKQLKRKLSPQNSSPQSKKQKQMDLHVFEVIRIGDWCFFVNKESYLITNLFMTIL